LGIDFKTSQALKTNRLNMKLYFRLFSTDFLEFYRHDRANFPTHESKKIG